MLYKRKISLFLLFAAGLLCNASDFFRGPDKTGADLPPDKIYPQGRIFPFSGFQPKNVRMLKEAGFTMAGPSYGTHTSRLAAEAAKLDFPFIYPISAEGITLKTLSGKKEIDWEAVRNDIAAKVKQASDAYPNITWWYLQPEELRYWRKNEYRYLKEASETIRKTDPLRRPVWMYIPNHYDAAALAKYAPYLNILGKGMYTGYSGNQDQRVWARWSSENQVRAIRESKADCIPLCVPEMFQDQDVEKIPKYVRHDVYLSLICGSRGVVVFSIAERRTMRKAVHQAYWEAYSQIARELRKLGEVFLFGEDRSDLKGTLLSGPSSQTITLAGRQTKPTALPTVSWMEKRTASGRYLFAVNSSESPVRFRFEKLPPARVLEALSGKELSVCGNGVLELSFQGLEVKLLKLEPR